MDLPVEEDDSLLPIEVEAVELARTASASSSTDKGSSSKPRSRSSASSKPQSIAPTAPPNPVASSSRAPLSAAAAGKLSRAATEKEKKEKKEREREEEEEQSRIKAEEMIKVEEEDGNKRSTRGRRKVQQPQEDLYKEFFAEDEEGEGEDGGEGVTRCVCGMDRELRVPGQGPKIGELMCDEECSRGSGGCVDDPVRYVQVLAAWSLRRLVGREGEYPSPSSAATVYDTNRASRRWCA